MFPTGCTRVVSRLLGAAAIVSLAVLSGRSSGVTAIDSTCLVAAPEDTLQFTSTNLNTNTPTKSGVTWDASGAALQLTQQAAIFKQSSINIGQPVFLACGGDYDGDGWTDFIGAGPDNDAWARFYKNGTKTNSDLVTSSQWWDTSFVVAPIFTATTTLKTGSSMGGGSVGCGDVNKDGAQDFIYVRCSSGNNCTPSHYHVYLGNGDGTFETAYALTPSASTLARLGWSGNSIEIVDWNGDSWPDLVYGLSTGNGSSNDGKLVVLLSDKAASPTFGATAADVVTLTSSPGLLPPSGKSATGINAVAVRDFTGDGTIDVIVGGSSGANAPMYRDKMFSSGVIANLTGFTGGAQSMMPADFDLDGKIDLIIATDGKNGRSGEKVFYWRNNGTTTPFSGSPTVLVNGGLSNTGDLDLGFALDYDHDPAGTPDTLVSDGNDSGKFFILANRAIQKYVECGTVTSTKVDVGALAESEATVTTVRLRPTQTVPSGTTVSYWATVNSDDATPTWVQATSCDDGAYCASFSALGREIKWKAELCSDDDNTATPQISGVAIDYSYVEAGNHYRGGPIARDGLIYVGAAQLPGDNGHLFAIDDETGTVLWDAATLLDGNVSRRIFIAAGGGTVELDSSAAADVDVQTALAVGSTADATALATWWKSARFGLLTPRVLGAVETSTPALLSVPRTPAWYALAVTAASERAALDTFVEAHAARKQLVLVGARDGALHAFHTNPANAADANNGAEAWAFIPPAVASALNGDRTSQSVSSYVDGSPTLANAKVGGAWRTVLVMGQGNGGRSVFALDVTSTVGADGSVAGPTYLWSYTDPNMGLTQSKPTIIRVQIAGEERWLAVFASGAGASADVGDTVYAVNLDDGTLAWRFDLEDTGTYVSSDVAALETDDETGTARDGFIDRLVFADSKGRVWKLDPAAFDAGAKTIASLGAVDVGLGPRALFATELDDALDAQRGISGPIAVTEDTDDQTVIYLGTGGTPNTAADATNALFAIELESGAIRRRADVEAGVKFYGGATAVDGQIVTATSSATGSGVCASSSGEIVAFDSGSFEEEFSTSTGSAVVGPVFVRPGQLYLVTQSGTVVTTGYVDAAAGEGLASDPAVDGEVEDPFAIVSWKQSF